MLQYNIYGSGLWLNGFVLTSYHRNGLDSTSDGPYNCNSKILKHFNSGPAAPACFIKISNFQTAFYCKDKICCLKIFI